MSILPPPAPLSVIESTLAVYNAIYDNAKYTAFRLMVESAVAAKYPALSQRDVVIVASAVMNRVIDASINLCDPTNQCNPGALERARDSLRHYERKCSYLLRLRLMLYCWDFMFATNPGARAAVDAINRPG
jgi:hypothetical protein